MRYTHTTNAMYTSWRCRQLICGHAQITPNSVSQKELTRRAKVMEYKEPIKRRRLPFLCLKTGLLLPKDRFIFAIDETELNEALRTYSIRTLLLKIFENWEGKFFNVEVYR